MKKQNEKYEICGMTFMRHKFSGLDGKAIVSYSEDSGLPDPFEVRITMAGMQFKGSMQGHISSEAEVQDWARFMSDWVQDLRSLRPRIETSLSGH